MDTGPRSGCAINAAVEVLGDPWSMLVLRDIMFGNRRHFRELTAGSEEGIATNILASRLKQLVAAGLLTRETAKRGQRVAYSLTESGIQVLPVMVAALHGSGSQAFGRYLPSTAGRALFIMHSGHAMLSPWTGFGIFLLYAAVVLAAAALDRKSTRLNSSHTSVSRMPSSA